MSYSIKDRDQHFQSDGTPKRILALDGGGLRGILSLSILGKIESALKERHGRRGRFPIVSLF